MTNPPSPQLLKRENPGAPALKVSKQAIFSARIKTEKQPVGETSGGRLLQKSGYPLKKNNPAKNKDLPLKVALMVVNV
jgi:hypothetical protein